MGEKIEKEIKNIRTRDEGERENGTPASSSRTDDAIDLGLELNS